MRMKSVSTIIWGRLTLACAAAAIFAMPAAAQDKRFEGVVLRVATFGGGYDKVLHETAGARLEQLGAKVEYVTGPPRDSLAKLIAAKGRAAPFDVIEMDNTWVDAKEAGFLERINLDNIPNKKHLQSNEFDEWKVASWITQEGIAYNVEKFKELGIPAPERYADLLHPKLAGRLCPIDITVSGSVQMIIAAAIDAGGSLADHDAGFEWLRKANALKFWKVGAEAITLLKTGDVYATMMHSGHTYQAKLQGIPVAFVHPRAGSMRGVLKEGWLGVVKGSKSTAAAEIFIDAYIDESTQMNLARKRGTVPVNGLVRAKLDTDPELKAIFDLADVNNMVRVDFSKLDMPSFSRKWQRAVAK